MPELKGLVEIQTDRAPRSTNPLSQGVRAGDILFLSGQVPRDPDTGELVKGDFEAEVRRVLENVKAVVEAAGGSLSRICKINAYVSDPTLVPAFNNVYREYFTARPLPCRTTVGCSLGNPDIHIEVDAVAYLG